MYMSKLYHGNNKLSKAIIQEVIEYCLGKRSLRDKILSYYTSKNILSRPRGSCSNIYKYKKKRYAMMKDVNHQRCTTFSAAGVSSVAGSAGTVSCEASTMFFSRASSLTWTVFRSKDSIFSLSIIANSLDSRLLYLLF